MIAQVNDLFGKLQPEQPEEKKDFVREASVAEDLLNRLGLYLKQCDTLNITAKGLGELISEFIARLPRDNPPQHDMYRDFFNLSPQHLINLAPDCYKLLNTNPLRASIVYALFLSDLMTYHSELKVEVRHPLPYFGAQYRTYSPHRCNLVVKGTLGVNAFSTLQSGTIVVEGSVGHYAAAHMRLGNILIKQDAGDYLGFDMKGGTIVVQGEVGDSVGCHSSDGIIQLLGKGKPRVAEKCRARIYHHGKEIRR
jgi:hypothetical protein